MSHANLCWALCTTEAHFTYLFVGIVQRDFKLSEEPELGLWQIVVELPSQTVRQHFEVNEYGTYFLDETF